MPKSHIRIATPLRRGLQECFHAATRLVPPEKRHQLVLVGGAASIAHGSIEKTGDVDLAGPPAVLCKLFEAIEAGASRLTIESDGKLAYDTTLDFRIRIDILSIGTEGSSIDAIYATEDLWGGCVASKSEFLRFRAKTVVERGSDGEVDDFRWLLARVARLGQILPKVSADLTEYVYEAGLRSELADRLLLGAVLGANNAPGAIRLLTLKS